jgi:hypothetical protein
LADVAVLIFTLSTGLAVLILALLTGLTVLDFALLADLSVLVIALLASLTILVFTLLTRVAVLVISRPAIIRGDCTSRGKRNNTDERDDPSDLFCCGGHMLNLSLSCVPGADQTPYF